MNVLHWMCLFFRKYEKWHLIIQLTLRRAAARLALQLLFHGLFGWAARACSNLFGVYRDRPGALVSLTYVWHKNPNYVRARHPQRTPPLGVAMI
jgi:hypothetical protein